MADGQHTGKPIKRKDNHGHYVLGEKLGEGAEGEVYSVANSRQWAVKVYKPGKARGGAGVHKTGGGFHPALGAQRTQADAQTVHQVHLGRAWKSDGRLPDPAAGGRQATKNNRTGNGS